MTHSRQLDQMNIIDWKGRCLNFEQQNLKLHDQIDELKEMIRQLKSDLCDEDKVPHGLFLTRTEKAVLDTLISQKMASAESILNSCTGYGSKPQPEIKIIAVYISKLRSKLRNYDIKIETNYGLGYYLTQESKDKIAHILAIENGLGG